jgi:hypothetical protein
MVRVDSLINRRYIGLASRASVALGVLLGPSLALANGRYPLSQQLLVDPTDAKHLFLRSTYGVLTSADVGVTWSWLCESGIGYAPGEDPMMAILGDGTVLAAASRGVFVTRDRGCSWPKNASIGDRFVRDLAVEGDGMAVLAATVEVDKDGHYDAAVWRSSDGAETWATLGRVTADSVLPFTLDVAPSDSRRIYVTAAVLAVGTDAGAVSDAGRATSHGVLYRSTNGGVTWDERPIPGTTRDSAPFIAAVHPGNPEVLYVRVRGDWDGTNPVASRLLYSPDAGDTWREVFRARADMLGFALAPDGETVLIGMGDTHDVLRPVDSAALGVYRGTEPVFEFSRVRGGQVGCLSYSREKLYLCGAEESDGFELGASNDDGTTVSPVFHYGSVAGPLSCPADTPQVSVCGAEWAIACSGLGVCPRPDAGTPAGARGRAPGGCCGSASSGARAAELGVFSGVEESFVAGAAVVAGLLRRRIRGRPRALRHPRH